MEAGCRGEYGTAFNGREREREIASTRGRRERELQSDEEKEQMEEEAGENEKERGNATGCEGTEMANGWREESDGERAKALQRGRIREKEGEMKQGKRKQKKE